jgi:hypothetical protein
MDYTSKVTSPTINFAHVQSVVHDERYFRRSCLELAVTAGAPDALKLAGQFYEFLAPAYKDAPEPPTDNACAAQPAGPCAHVLLTKQIRKDLDVTLQHLKSATGLAAAIPSYSSTRTSNERIEAIRKIQEAIMWLGMDLKAMREEGLSDEPSPYPSSYNPGSGKVEPTADGLHL